MATTTVSARGCVVIPLEMRRKYGLNPGDRVALVDYGGVLSFVPQHSDLIGQSAGRFRGKTSLVNALLTERAQERVRE